MTFGEKLKYYRKARNWTQAELSKRSGVGQNQIARYENGQRVPRYDKVVKLADALQIGTDFLLRDSDSDIIAVRLSQLRPLFGLSQDALAECSYEPLCGRDIDDFEMGRMLPSSRQLSDIVDRFRRCPLGEQEIGVDPWEKVMPILDDLGKKADELKEKEDWKHTREVLKRMGREDLLTDNPTDIATYSVTVSEDQLTLLSKYSDLNEEGKAEAVKRLEELTQIPKYQKKT